MSTAIRASLAISVALCLVGCIDPKDQRPGLELRGDVVQQFPADWNFANAHREIEIQVATPYWIPHSVTIWCAAAGDALYVGARNPDSKRWPGWVERDPNVRLRIGDQIYAARLAVIDAADEIAQVRRAYVAKYDLPDPPPEGGPPMRYWSVEPRS
jgi:hypothetical protein